MFKVSFNVSDSSLASVLSALDGLVAVKVQHCAEMLGETTTKSPRKTRKASTAKKRTAAQARRDFGEPTTSKASQATTLVRSFGLQPFRASEIIKKGEAAGIGRSQVYNAIYGEINQGNLRKLDVGLYQKTGQGAVAAA